MLPFLGVGEMDKLKSKHGKIPLKAIMKEGTFVVKTSSGPIWIF